MYLADLLTLFSDLHPNLQLFYQIRKSDVFYPINKIQVEGNRCLILTGEKAKTILQINQLLQNLKHTSIPVYVYIKELDKKEKIFGVQIDLEKGHVYIF